MTTERMLRDFFAKHMFGKPGSKIFIQSAYRSQLYFA
jgi:hypothetical protein